MNLLNKITVKAILTLSLALLALPGNNLSANSTFANSQLIADHGHFRGGSGSFHGYQRQRSVLFYSPGYWYYPYSYPYGYYRGRSAYYYNYYPDYGNYYQYRYDPQDYYYINPDYSNYVR